MATPAILATAATHVEGLPPSSEQTGSLLGRDVEVLSASNLQASESNGRPVNNTRNDARRVAIEIGRWVSYALVWIVPVIVYIAAVTFAALVSPYTAFASVPAFAGVCYAINNHAVPAISRHFNERQVSSPS